MEDTFQKTGTKGNAAPLWAKGFTSVCISTCVAHRSTKGSFLGSCPYCSKKQYLTGPCTLISLVFGQASQVRTCLPSADIINVHLHTLDCYVYWELNTGPQTCIDAILPNELSITSRALYLHSVMQIITFQTCISSLPLRNTRPLYKTLSSLIL